MLILSLTRIYVNICKAIVSCVLQTFEDSGPFLPVLERRSAVRQIAPCLAWRNVDYMPKLPPRVPHNHYQQQ